MWYFLLDLPIQENVCLCWLILPVVGHGTQPARQLQWRFQAVLDSAVKKFDRTKIIFQWLRGGGGWQEPGVYKICFVVNCRKLVNDKSSAHLTRAAGVLKLKIINNVNIYPAICHSWKVYTECVYIFCRCWMSLTGPGQTQWHLNCVLGAECAT